MAKCWIINYDSTSMMPSCHIISSSNQTVDLKLCTIFYEFTTLPKSFGEVTKCNGTPYPNMAAWLQHGNTSIWDCWECLASLSRIHTLSGNNTVIDFFINWQAVKNQPTNWPKLGIQENKLRKYGNKTAKYTCSNFAVVKVFPQGC